MRHRAYAGLSEKQFDAEVRKLRRTGRIKPKAKPPTLRKEDCTPRQWAAALEYSRVTYAKRKGVPLAPPKEVRLQTKEGIEVFSDFRAACNQFGVNYSTASWRKSHLGWSNEQALGLKAPPGRKKTRTNYTKKSVCVRFKRRVMRFESQVAAFRAFGIDETVGQARLGRGYTLEQALALAPPPERQFRTRGNKTVVRHQGTTKTFPSFKAACRFFGIEPDRAYQQLGRGWSIPQALGLKSPPLYDASTGGSIYVITHTASGKQYVGMTRLSVEERWRQHCEEANDILDGEAARPLVVAIRNHGIDEFVVQHIDSAANLSALNRKERHWIDKLKTKVPTGFNVMGGGSGPQKGTTFDWKGQTFRSAKEIASHFGINPITFSSRWRNGATLEEALGLTGRYTDRSIPTEVQGKKFESRWAAAQHYGVNYGTFMTRLKDGWPIEEALDLVRERPRKRRFARVAFAERMHAAYDVADNGCWEWKERTCGTTGLPVVSHEGRRWMAARLVYELLRSPIPENALCLRTCGNNLCVNPDHMVIGDHAEMHRIAGDAGTRKGVNAYQAKVTDKDVVLIRSFLKRHRHFQGRPGPTNFLARWFGLTVSSVRDIDDKRTWAHIQ
jgi:hypothetical protein